MHSQPDYCLERGSFCVSEKYRKIANGKMRVIMLRNTKWMVGNSTHHLFTFSVAVILASNDNSIDDKNSLLLAFLNKMYFAVT